MSNKNKNNPTPISRPIQLEHIPCWMTTLVGGCTQRTAMAIYCLNIPSISWRLPNEVKEHLISKGYTTVYILTLFSKTGSIVELCDKPLDQLINHRCDEVIEEVIPDVEKVFFAYGEPENEKLSSLISQRVEAVRNKILTIKPSTEFFYFGALFKSGHPKALDDVNADDHENLYILPRKGQ